MGNSQKAPLKEKPLPAQQVSIQELADGSLVLRSPEPFRGFEATLPERFARVAEDTPDAVFLTDAAVDGGRRTLTFREAKRRSDAIGAALLARGLGPERPLMILSGNSIEHALMLFGGMAAGVPVVPVSPGYSLMSRDHTKLKHVYELVRPAMVFAQSDGPFSSALRALDLSDTEVVVAESNCSFDRSTPFEDLSALGDEPSRRKRVEHTDADAPALYLFTSGSTAMPKAVIYTQRTIATGMEMTSQVLFRERMEADWTPPPRSRHAVDWLPWHHISGSTMLWSSASLGTTLHIDGGRPAPGQFDKTLSLLRTVSPCFYMNVPVGYRMLVAELEEDANLRRTFFADLDFLLYGAASLPADIYTRMQDLAVQTIGRRLLFLSAYGSTETCGSVTFTYFECDPTGLLGLPVPGVEIKLVPHGRVYECRVRGPNVTPGYLGSEPAKENAFDAEGFLRTGDLVDWAVPDRPEMGLAYVGRLAEEFKLSSGTWVSGSMIRAAVIDAAAPLVSEAVVVGPNRDFVALLIWLNEVGCRAKDDAFDPEQPWDSDAVVGEIRTAIDGYNERNTGSSKRVARITLITEPLSSDAGELSDKGSVNHRAVRERRAETVELLYSDPPGVEVISFESF